MADTDKSFELDENGLLFDGKVGIFGNDGIPTFDAPDGSLYLQTDGKLWFRVNGEWTDQGQFTVDALTEYEAFTSPSLESTTSNNWVTKSGYPYTSEVKTAGKFIVDFTAVIGQSNSNKVVGFQVEYRLGTSGTWIELFSILEKYPQSNGESVITSFREIELLTDSVIQIRLNWGQTDNGGTGRIEQANIKLGKVAS
jgi:hypothetical protein